LTASQAGVNKRNQTYTVSSSEQDDISLSATVPIYFR
jgi:hypothetical protein